nr:hypothetical protein [Tanacetum cinerariifolium]
MADWNAVYDAHNEVACLMLGSMTPELHRQFKNYAPYEMLQELKSMFEKQAEVERFDLIQTFLACKEEEGKPVATYVLQMKGYTFGELHPMLIEYEKCLPKKAETPQVMMIKGGKNQKEIRNRLKLKHPTKDDTCHHYMEVGYWKRNCPVYLVELSKKKKQVGTANSSDNYHYAPSITRSVVSVHRLVENGFVQSFIDFGILISKNNVLYFNAIPSNGIYEIDMHDLVPNKRIEKLQQEGLLKSTDDESFDQCVSCLSGKMTRKSFPHRPERATGLLGIIHTDALMKRDTPDKLQQRSVKCIFIGYPKEMIEVSGRAIDLEEIQNEDTSPSEITCEIPIEVEGFEPPQEEEILICRTFSPVADIKAIRILISIAALYDYKIWQMDVKTAFLNGHLDEDIYMVQPEDFVDPKHPRKASGSNVTFLILYVDDIIIMGNHIPSLQSVKDYLGMCFAMKDLREATFILGIKIYRNRPKRLIRLGQNAYMDKILKRYRMDNSKRGQSLCKKDLN